MTATEIKSFAMKKHGFGYEVMKEICVCEKCGKLTSAKQLRCPSCGVFLPRKNLFDLYRTRHRSCKACGTILSDAMRYCPKCGNNNEGAKKACLYRCVFGNTEGYVLFGTLQKQS